MAKIVTFSFLYTFTGKGQLLKVTNQVQLVQVVIATSTMDLSERNFLDYFSHLFKKTITFASHSAIKRGVWHGNKLSHQANSISARKIEKNINTIFEFLCGIKLNNYFRSHQNFIFSFQ